MELVNTVGTLGTFLVIAATAIAAIIQLRHARSSNQIEALGELREESATPEMQAAEQFVRHSLTEKLNDPAFRYQIANGRRAAIAAENQQAYAAILLIGNFFESMGALVKNGLAEKNVLLDIFSNRVLILWKLLAPVVLLVRTETQDYSIWENFEYLAVLSEDWETAFPNGNYPTGMRRMEISYPWEEADRQYAASLATT